MEWLSEVWVPGIFEKMKYVYVCSPEMPRRGVVRDYGTAGRQRLIKGLSMLCFTFWFLARDAFEDFNFKEVIKFAF